VLVWLSSFSTTRSGWNGSKETSKPNINIIFLYGISFLTT
jgi:hypothetical protein